MNQEEQEDDNASARVDLEARPYQNELLEKAKKGNIIVYLGTGAGKTYIAVMMIKELRSELNKGKKALFLVNSVPLVDQQAEAIRRSTGFSVGSYCGADGVDDWDDLRWYQETQKHQVLVLVHQVFLDMLTHGHFKLSDAVLMVMDECHHAQSMKDHPYTKIMLDWYHQQKEMGKKTPKILGLTACLMVKNVTPEKFQVEKQKLEKILDAKVETTEDLYEILKYVTNPDETVEEYDNLGGADGDIIMTICETAMSDIADIYAEELNVIETGIGDINYRATAKTDLKRHYSVMKNDILNCIITGIREVGLVSFILSFSNFKSMNEKIHVASHRAYYNSAIKSRMGEIMKNCFGQLRIQYYRHPYQDPNQRSLRLLMSSCSKKMLKLAEILRDSSQDSRILVFVEAKFSAEAVCRILVEFSKYDATLSHLRPDYCYSPGAKMNPKDPEERKIINEERRKLKTTLKHFKEGKVNILISTSVVEEGLDVRSCNLVIKFDFPMTFRSYVQSKGRARAKPSRYILMIDGGNDLKLRKKYDSYREMEEMSLYECHQQPFENNKDIFDEFEYDQPYIADPDDPDSARITGSQAVRMVHKYIQKIKVDRFTRLTPVWITDYVEGSHQDTLFAGLGTSSKSGYQVTCYMPHRTPFTAPIKGDIVPSKKGAKQSTALQICEQLHYFGELDSRLKVRKYEKLLYDDDDDDEDDERVEYNPNNRKTGTKKMRRFYPKIYPDLLLINPNSSNFYLNSIKYKLCRKNEGYKYKTYNPGNDGAILGVITSKMLPAFDQKIPLYHPGGEYQVDIMSSVPVSISMTQMSLIKNFHKYVISTVLKVSSRMDINEKDLLIVPVKGGHLDDNLLNSFSNNESSALKRIKISKKISHDCVIFPGYKEDKENYFIEEFIPPSVLTVDSRIHNMALTFRQYYDQTYGLKVSDSNQSLLKISSADRHPHLINCVGSQTGKKSKKKDIYDSSLFIPEFMEVEPISSGLWRQCQMMPFVLHRISTLIYSRDFLISLGYHCPSIKADLKPRALSVRNTDIDLLKLENPENVDYQVSAGNILEAVTLKGANDNFDMERLEVLGDVFLKYYTGVFLYNKLLDKIVVNTEEGDLTSKRSKVVGNKNLCKIAMNLNLDKYIVSCPLETQHSWCPPNYDRIRLESEVIELNKKFGAQKEGDRVKTLSVGSLLSWITEEELDLMRCNKEELLNKGKERFQNNQDCASLKFKSHKLINDKSMADCIEALIGCFMLVSGQAGALKFMSKIGLNLSSDNTVDDLLNRVLSGGEIKLFSSQRDAFYDARTRDLALEDESDRASVLYQKLGVSDIEKILGYTFNEKSFLLQAFTHASYFDNRLTGSYERLEYIGDAVLDYLVTVYVYTNHSQSLGPGQITDIRSALVCNNMFASVLVDNRLDSFILMQSPALMKMINEYVEDKHGSDKNILVNRINEVEPPEIKDVEVPKVLGDVFESLIGAVFIDSGHDLKTVWKVFKKLFKDIDGIIKKPPKNAKKELLEMFPENVEFSFCPHKEMMSAIVTVKKNDKPYPFKGLGHNKVSAQIAACKLALRHFKRNYKN